MYKDTLDNRAGRSTEANIAADDDGILYPVQESIRIVYDANEMNQYTSVRSNRRSVTVKYDNKGAAKRPKPTPGELVAFRLNCLDSNEYAGLVVSPHVGAKALGEVYDKKTIYGYALVIGCYSGLLSIKSHKIGSVVQMKPMFVATARTCADFHEAQYLCPRNKVDMLEESYKALADPPPLHSMMTTAEVDGAVALIYGFA